MIVMYSTIPDEEIRKSAEEGKQQLKDWFAANPERTDCDMKCWYGKRVMVKKETIDQQIDEAAKEAMKGVGDVQENTQLDAEGQRGC